MDNLKIGKQFIVTGVLPFSKNHLFGKKGMIIEVDLHRAFPVKAWIDGRTESFTINDIKVL